MSQVTEIHTEPVITLLDAELPFLAARAAVELDNLLLGSKSTTPTVDLLLKRLANSIRGERGAKQLFTDSPSAALMFESLGQTSTTAHQEAPAAVSELDVICDALKSFAPRPNENNDDKGSIERARNFFLALSQKSAVYTYGGGLNKNIEPTAGI